MKKIIRIIIVLLTLLTVCGSCITFAACKNHIEHDFGEWETVKESSCIEIGQRKRVCKECGHEEFADVPKSEHVLSEYEVTRQPDCISQGEKAGKCSVCKQTVTVAVDALGHDPSEKYFFNDDTHWRQCTRCQNKSDDAAHVKQDGKCSVCDWSDKILAELTYELLEDGTYSVTGYSNEDATAVVIPATYRDVKVSTVVARAFWGKTNVTSLTIADGVTALGNYAFGQTGIKSVIIPDSVTECGDGIFQKCQALEKAVLGRGLTQTPSSMFYLCGNLKEVDIPENVTAIGQYTFTDTGITELHFKSPTLTLAKYAVYKAEKLHTVVFEEGVEQINVATLNYPFYYCAQLTTLRFPSTLNSVSANLWSQMSSLESIEVADRNETYKAVDGILYNAELTKMIKVPSSKAGVVNIQRGVTNIASSAFWCCDKITAVIIPNSVTKISTGAFGYTALTAIAFPDSVTSFGQDIFEGVTTLKKISFGSGASSGVDAIMRNCKSALEEITVSENNAKYMSRDNTLLSKDGKTLYISNASAAIPQGVQILGRHAFAGNSKLREITIPEGVVTVAGFVGCENLTKVTLASTVKTIDNAAFSKCTSLTTFTVPASVTKVGQEAFYKCTALQSSIFENTVGWNQNGSSSTGAAVDVTNPQTNAQQLTSSNMRTYYIA